MNQRKSKAKSRKPRSENRKPATTICGGEKKDAGAKRVAKKRDDATSRQFGSLRGVVTVDETFFEPLPSEELEAWDANGGIAMTDESSTPERADPTADAFADLRLEAAAKLDERAVARAQLYAAIQAALPHLEQVLATVQSHWHAPDLFYRFYHQSFKVYRCNEATAEMVRELQALASGRPLNEWFLAIVADAASRKFSPEVNARWLEATSPVIAAFLHAKMFLELVVQAGHEPEPRPGHSLRSAWAAVLTLYGLRY